MRIAILTDVHANLPAWRAARSAIEAEGCDAIVHVGDAVGIGPFPAETLDDMLSTPKLRFIMGNHDAWFAFGVPEPKPDWMPAAFVEHHRWVREQMDPILRGVVAQWPFFSEMDCEGARLAFAHYGLAPAGRDFQSIVQDPGPADFDRMFEGIEADLIFYGHDHVARDTQGLARYVNAGSLGCWDRPESRWLLLETGPGAKVALDTRAAPYDDKALLPEFERRNVPGRAFIRERFIIR